VVVPQAGDQDDRRCLGAAVALHREPPALGISELDHGTQ
jgi:hypothetical protein